MSSRVGVMTTLSILLLIASGVHDDTASYARNPVPTNADRWVTRRDYDDLDLSEVEGLSGDEGIGLGFELLVSARGRVFSCTPTGSRPYRYPRLGSSVCALVEERAYFRPALNADGEPVPGSYYGSVSLPGLNLGTVRSRLMRQLREEADIRYPSLEPID